MRRADRGLLDAVQPENVLANGRMRRPPNEKSAAKSVGATKHDATKTTPPGVAALLKTRPPISRLRRDRFRWR